MPEEVAWDRSIEVPFAPETARSGVGDNSFYVACWYRRTIDPPALADGERLILHFGAVDYRASVWVDRSLAVEHEGGYTPFSVDITDFLRGAHAHEIVVRAEDDPADLGKPRGKQDWLLEPHSIWYPRTSGIWQTVWLEVVPPGHIAELRWTANLARWELGLEARVHTPAGEGCRLAVRLSVGDLVLAADSYTVVHGEVHRRIALSDPGIDDSRNGLLWSPHSPTLIDVELVLRDSSGRALDVVHSYTALRSITVQRDVVLLNGRPYPMRLVLDQGYWPETGLTAPDGNALRRDVELAKAMGFNGVRKHQKLEDRRSII
ncbi:MAG: hypothetical protein LC659_12080 [Myxococcales bacterium]|nr:hypothetical protein [Myxococcales bacterium]